MEPRPAITFEVDLLAARGTLLSQQEAEVFARTRTIFISTGLRGDDNFLGKHGDQFTLFGAQAIYFKELVQNGVILSVKVVEESAEQPEPVVTGDGAVSGSAVVSFVSSISSSGGLLASGAIVPVVIRNHVATGSAVAAGSAVSEIISSIGNGGLSGAGTANASMFASATGSGGCFANGSASVSKLVSLVGTNGVAVAGSASVTATLAGSPSGGVIAGGAAVLDSVASLALADYLGRVAAVGDGSLRSDHAAAVFAFLEAEVASGNYAATVEYIIPLGDTLGQSLVKLKYRSGSPSSCTGVSMTGAYSASRGWIGSAGSGRYVRTAVSASQVFASNSAHISLAYDKGYPTGTGFNTQGVFGAFANNVYFSLTSCNTTPSRNFRIGSGNMFANGDGTTGSTPIQTWNLTSTTQTECRNHRTTTTTGSYTFDPSALTDELRVLDLSNGAGTFSSARVDMFFCAYGTALPDPAARQVAIRDLKAALGRALTKQFVVVGDSITGFSNPNLSWASRGMTTLSSGYDFHMLGVSGDRIGDGSLSNHLRGTTRLSQLTPLLSSAWHCTTLVCHAGSNDIALEGASAATTYARSTAYITERQADGWQGFLWGTILPRGDAQAVAQDFYNRRNSVNSGLRTNAATLGITLMDWGADTTIGDDGDENNTTNYSDKIHPNTTGAAVMVPYFTNQLPGVIQ